MTLVSIWTNHSFLFFSGTNIHGKPSNDKGNTFKKHAWQLAHGFSLASGQYLALTKFSPVMEIQHQHLCQGKVSTCRQTSTDSWCIICDYVIPFFFFFLSFPCQALYSLYIFSDVSTCIQLWLVSLVTRSVGLNFSLLKVQPNRSF